MTGRGIVAVGVPTALALSPAPDGGGRPRGTWRAPAALRRAGLLERTGARNGGTIPTAPYDPAPDPRTGARNTASVAAQTRALAERLDAILSDAGWPLVVGGDCSVLLGAALALRRRGRHGLVFVDGHLDFRHLGNSPRLSAVAGEDLAIVTGRGLPELADLDGLAPYLADRDVVAVGEREHDPRGADAYASEIEIVDLDALRAAGAASAGHEAAAGLAGQGVDGFWIHVDVDVLDSELMPAVDSPQPGGLEPGELAELLAALRAHPLARGLEVTVYDPELDPDGACAERIVAVVAEALS